MMWPTLTFHGAAGTVTGSCYEIRYGKRSVLVDCGLFQGPRSLERLNFEPFRFNPEKLDAVLITHAHLDHCGLLPRLVKQGFDGVIWCTEATKDLLAVMLADAAKIQEQEAARRNRRPDRAGEPAFEPLYTADDVRLMLTRVRLIAFSQQFDVAPGIQARFWNAGHILGSASVEIYAGASHLLFSGDIGPNHKSFHADPDSPRGIDHLICESTYGDRNREEITLDQRQALLGSEIRRALGRGGNLIIPTFALERTQELLRDIGMLIRDGELPGISIFIDSPLASRATDVFRRHQSHLEDIGSPDIFSNPAFHYVESVDASIRLNDVLGAVILSASGMCEAGRIRHHLRHNLPRQQSTILFAGFQAKGTLGRTILDGAKRVRISGRDVSVRADIRAIDSYSAHADQSELLSWLDAREPVAGSMFLTHGEGSSLRALQAKLMQRSRRAIIPEIGETYALPPGAPAKLLSAGRSDLRSNLVHDWQNEYADLVVNLKPELQHIDSTQERLEVLRKMRSILKEYTEHKRKHRKST